MALLLCVIRSLATIALSLLSILYLCNNIAKGKRQNKVAHEKIEYPISIRGRGKPIIQPTQVIWCRFSTMLVWTQENIWNRVLLERCPNPFVVWKRALVIKEIHITKNNIQLIICGIIFNAFTHLLCSKLCRLNMPSPICT